jgi:hypothetical protein
MGTLLIGADTAVAGHASLHQCGSIRLLIPSILKYFTFLAIAHDISYAVKKYREGTPMTPLDAPPNYDQHLDPAWLRKRAEECRTKAEELRRASNYEDHKFLSEHAAVLDNRAEQFERRSRDRARSGTQFEYTTVADLPNMCEAAD